MKPCLEGEGGKCQCSNAYNPSICEVEAGGLETHLYSKSKNSLSSMRPCCGGGASWSEKGQESKVGVPTEATVCPEGQEQSWWLGWSQHRKKLEGTSYG